MNSSKSVVILNIVFEVAIDGVLHKISIEPDENGNVLLILPITGKTWKGGYNDKLR